MKRVLFVFLLQNLITAFSQTDSTKFFKNEISVYSDVFAMGFGTMYSRWNSPKQFYCIGLDINSVGHARHNSNNSASLRDTVFVISSNTYMTTSGGVRLGIGYRINASNPSLLFSTGIVAGTMQERVSKNENLYVDDADSTLRPIVYSVMETQNVRGIYGGLFGSCTLLADISRSLKFYASVSLDFCYAHTYREIPGKANLMFHERGSLGLKYYF